MKKLFNRGNSLMMLALVVGVLSFSACGKTGDTIAKVVVVKTSDGVSPVVGATVTLSATTDPANPNEPREGIEKETTTNSAGEANFNYNDLFKRGQAGLFVLDVSVEKDGVTAEGVIKVVEQETSETTVEINIP